MDVKLNPRLARQVGNDPRTAALLLQVAQRLVAPIAAATPVDDGETRASTRAEGGHRSADGDTVAARVVQSGAAVQLQFGNRHDQTPARQFDRGLGGV